MRSSRAPCSFACSLSWPARDRSLSPASLRRCFIRSRARAASSLAAAATRRARAASCFLRSVWIDSAEAAAACSSTTTAHKAATRVRVLVERIRARSHPPRGFELGKCEAERYLLRRAPFNPLRGGPGRYSTPQVHIPSVAEALTDMKRPEEPHGGVALPRTTSPIRTSGRGVKVQP